MTGSVTLVLAVLVAVVLSLLISVPVTYKVAVQNKAKKDAETLGTAEEKARSIIDEAIKTGDAKKREALLEVKEESLRTKNELERETKERRNELQKYEKRVLTKEETVDKKAEAVEKREQEVTAKAGKLQEREKKVEEMEAQAKQELERISGLTAEQAKAELVASIEEEAKVDIARRYRELEAQAKDDADKKAREYVVNAIQKCSVDHVSETTISVVPLPSDEMKGRIIGREGRNIRALEMATGVDLIIDDTPEAVVLSAFDPVRREIARVALEKLIVDGRIHPARIEEMVEKARREVEAQIREDGENAAMDVGVHGIHPELLKLLGRMKFRSSYGQNALKHSIEVAELCGLLAGEIGLDIKLAKRAGLLHDIGKSIDHEVEGSHIQIGIDLCRKYKESQVVINSVAAHHGDNEPESLIACIVQAADAISAARPGARRETLEAYTNRLKQLEDITNEFKGVEKSFAIQAGREVRVMVIPEVISDAEMVILAKDIAKQIETTLEYPGQIKVNVIRESRAVEYAK
ncbi:MAG: ribonuclease Y [Blautia sp.]|nr:ribonuclease Y [Blautia sp.]